MTGWTSDQRSRCVRMHLLIFTHSNSRGLCPYKPSSRFDCQSTQSANVKKKKWMGLWQAEWLKWLRPLHYALSVRLKTVFSHPQMNGWWKLHITPEPVMVPNQATHSFPALLSPPSKSKLLICLHHNRMNAQCTSVSSTPPCMHVYVENCTWSTWACDLCNPHPPPNLVIFSGTAASVIIGRSGALHTFLRWRSAGICGNICR